MNYLFITSHDPLMSGMQIRNSMDDLLMNNLVQQPIVIDEVKAQRPIVRIEGLRETKPIDNIDMDKFCHGDLDARKTQNIKICPEEDRSIGVVMDYAN